jgi:hypothetical protein
MDSAADFLAAQLGLTVVVVPAATVTHGQVAAEPADILHEAATPRALHRIQAAAGLEEVHTAQPTELDQAAA